MVAVSEVHIPVPTAPLTDIGHCAVTGRRAVAIAVTAAELLRPQSDLARLLAGFEHTDLLLAAEDRADGGGVVALAQDDRGAGADLAAADADGDAANSDTANSDAVRSDAADSDDDTGFDRAADVDGDVEFDAEFDADFEDADFDDDEDDDDEDEDDGVARAIEALDIAGLTVHRLGLGLPLVASTEGDVVAALSELVGFDPEAGVYCLAPAQAAGDPARFTVNRAAQRIAQVYGLPLLRYRCLELSVVGS